MSDKPEYKFENFYECPRCGHQWTDAYECQVDDDCQECGMRHISPYKSIDLPGLDNSVSTDL